MRNLKIIFGAALAFLITTAIAAGPSPDRTLTVRAEGSAPISAGLDKARANALKNAKAAAVKNYITARVPPVLQQEKAAEIGKILGNVDSYVVTWSPEGESQVQGKLVVKAEVVLNREKLDTALKSLGLVPGRVLPAVIVSTTCMMGTTEIPSAWKKGSPSAGNPNPCETALGRALEKYGFTVVRSVPDLIPADPAKIFEPADDNSKRAFLADLGTKLAAGALVVGRYSLSAASASSPIGVSWVAAAADLEKGTVVWSDQKDKLQAKAGTNANQLLTALCADSADRAAAELFRSWIYSGPAAGPAKAVSLTLRGLPSYVLMKEFERRLKTEGPGVSDVTIARMSPGEITYTVKTGADAKALADWIAMTRPGGLNYQLAEQDQNHVVMKVTK